MLSHVKKVSALVELLRSASDSKTLVAALDDLLTPQEIDTLYERVQIIACLKKGYSQRETLKRTGAALATVNRGAKVLKKASFSLGKLIDKVNSTGWWRTIVWRA